jgi:hypothetical protein
MQTSTRLCSKFTPTRIPSFLIKIASKCWPITCKIQRKPSASFFCCIVPTVHLPLPFLLHFSTFYLDSMLFYQKDERALPGNIQGSKFLCFPLLIIRNVVPVSAPPVLFLLSRSPSLSLSLLGISVLPFISPSVCLISGATQRIIVQFSVGGPHQQSLDKF